MENKNKAAQRVNAKALRIVAIQRNYSVREDNAVLHRIVLSNGLGVLKTGSELHALGLSNLYFLPYRSKKAA